MRAHMRAARRPPPPARPPVLAHVWSFLDQECPESSFWGEENAPARNAAVPSNLGWKKHPLGALRGPGGAGRPAGILTFFWFFQNGLKRSPRALGGPGGTILHIFALFWALFWAPGGGLGPGPPYLPLRAAALWGSTSGAVYTGVKVQA